MIIESEYGKVDGVELTGSDGRSRLWTKHENGRTISFHSDDGWAEVQEPRCVDVTGECKVELMGTWSRLCIPIPGGEYFSKTPDGIFFQQVDRYAIDPCEAWGMGTTQTKVDFLKWIDQFKTACLTVQRKETP